MRNLTVPPDELKHLGNQLLLISCSNVNWGWRVGLRQVYLTCIQEPKAVGEPATCIFKETDDRG
jgi:hypothetical protein